MSRLGIAVGARYRTVAEPQILELLLLCGLAYQCRGTGRASALREVSDALDRWIGLGLPFEKSPDSVRRFDPAEVVNFFKWAGLSHGDRFWEDRFIVSGRRLIREFHALETAEGVLPPPTSLSPRRFSVTLQREFNLGHCEPGRRVRLRVPLPLEDHSLGDLAITPIPPRDCAVEFAVTPGRLDAQFLAPSSGMVTLGVEVSFVTRPVVPEPRPAALTAEERELYERPREGIIQVSPRIRALAAELAGSKRDPWTQVQGFWNYMLDRMTCGVLHYDELGSANPVDWILDTGWFDCHLGSALLVALCRARGIPARLVSGYLLYPASPSYHYWAEAWVVGRGWVPMDLVCSDLSARGRDTLWRDYFLGCLDYRMKTQCLPRLFDRTPTVRFPPAWHILPRPHGDGAEIGFFARDSGELIYRDQISVRPGVGAATSLR
jgi:hypothetical protein